MINPEWIGYIAATFTTVSSLPQLARVIRTRHTHSISLWMYVLVVCGAMLWTIYGIFIHSPSIVACNAISLFSSGAILGMKLRHG